MKQRLPWILTITMLLCAVVVLFWPTKPKPHQQAQMSFLCFSNAATGPEVVFAVHSSLTNIFSWKDIEVDHWEFGTWQTWYGGPSSRAPGMRLQSGPLQATVASNSKPISVLAGFYLPNTNDSWRIRAHLEEMRPLSFIERLTHLATNRRQAKAYQPNTPEGFSYWMTNVVGPEAARQ